MTVNTALGAAAAAPALGHNFSLFWFALAIAIAGLLLVKHYNRRVTGARETATTLTRRLNSSFGIDYDDITKAEPAKTNGFWRYLSSLKPPLSYSAGEYYDWQELWIFSAILAVSPFLVFLVCGFRRSRPCIPN